MNMITAMEQFIESLQERDVSPLTIKGYKSDLTDFMRWFAETQMEIPSIETVTPTDIKAYKHYLLVDKRYKASTVNRKLSALSAMMQWAHNKGMIQVDPTSKIKGVKVEVLSPKWLDKKEQFALVRAIEKDLQVSRLRYPKRWLTRRRDASLVIFLQHTGLRLEELASLRVNDLDISARKGKVTVQNGKGCKQRSIPLNREARNAVEEWLKVRPPKSNFLWIAVEAGEESKLSGRTVQRILKRYAQDAELKLLTPHVLRHTFAKNLIDSGVGLETVAVLLGHDRINTTKIYTVPGEKDLEDAVKKVE